jgi:hypothetical protein
VKRSIGVDAHGIPFGITGARPTGTTPPLAGLDRSGHTCRPWELENSWFFEWWRRGGVAAVAALEVAAAVFAPDSHGLLVQGDGTARGGRLQIAFDDLSAGRDALLFDG